MYLRVFNIFISFFIASNLAHALTSPRSSLCQPHLNTRNLVFSSQIIERNHNEFSLIVWNAHKLADKNFLPDLRNLSEDADLILIQEAMHSDSLAAHLISQFAFDFSFFKSFCNSDKIATGVMNMARINLLHNRTLVSPDSEPFTNTPKVSGYSQLNIPGIGAVHVINTHGLNFNLGNKFARQIDAIVRFAQQLEGPLIWAGDFNTWSDWRKDYLQAATQKLGLEHLKPAYDTRRLKLDHVYARGLKVKSTDLLVNIRSSDHLPIKVIFSRPQP